MPESEAALRELKPRVPMGHLGVISESPLKLHPPNAQRHIVTKIANLNKKIRRARQNKTRSTLIAKRDKLKKDSDFESNWGPIQLQIAFNNAYRSHRIAGYPGIDPNTFFVKIRKMLVDLIHRKPPGKQ